jgi:hypothetical protein
MHESDQHSPGAPSASDLMQFDDEYAETKVEERTHDEIPDGKYQVNVEKAELVRAKNSGNPMLRWELRILAPRCQGRMLFRHNVLATRENLKWLKTDLHTCGLDLEKVSDLPKRLGALLDVKLEVTKRSKGENSNVYLNRRIVLDGAVAGAQDDGRDPGYDAAAADALTPF